MDVNMNGTLLQSKSLNNDLEKMSADGARMGAQLEAQAMEDALWRMAANNAMAKLKGFNTLARAANELS